jgi:hypothetical protein
MTKENAEDQPASPDPSKDQASSGFWSLSEEEIKKSVQIQKEDIPFRIPKDRIDRWNIEKMLWETQEKGS